MIPKNSRAFSEKGDTDLSQKNTIKQEFGAASGVRESVNQHKNRSRRDFLTLATGITGCCGAAAVAWPFIAQMRPDAASQAAQTLEVDISEIETGTSLIVAWRGKPVVIRNRTMQEIEAARAISLEMLKDKQARNANLELDQLAHDEARCAGEGRENWLIMVNLCTHLGCVPIGGGADNPGWFCPCHGSTYDTAGRVLTGPAGQNMAIPPYKFITDGRVKIG